LSRTLLKSEHRSLEQNVTIIAASIPPLYSVFRSILGKRSTARDDTYYGPGNVARKEYLNGYGMNSGHGTSGHAVTLTTISHKPKKDPYAIDDDYDLDMHGDEVDMLPKRLSPGGQAPTQGITRTTELTISHETNDVEQGHSWHGRF
jgi:hypothetical protein